MKLFLVFASISLFHIYPLFAENTIDYDYEVDAYYTNVSAFLDLDSENEVTDAHNWSEAQIYTDLTMKSFEPNIFLVEAAIHPMSIFGLYFRRFHEELYSKASIDNFSIVKALTAGYEEPYSFSLFFGRMMIFKNKKDGDDTQRVGGNRAYIGYLVTVGDHSIKDNIAYFNRWINFEYKLKGTREKQESDLDWSFRLGYRINTDKNFVDTFYFGARRSSIDYRKSVWSRFHNSAFSVLVEFSAETGAITTGEFTIEKKFPLSWTEKISLGIAIGYLFTNDSKYKGELRDDGVNNHQLIFRPNLKF